MYHNGAGVVKKCGIELKKHAQKKRIGLIRDSTEKNIYTLERKNVDDERIARVQSIWLVVSVMLCI